MTWCQFNSEQCFWSSTSDQIPGLRSLTKSEILLRICFDAKEQQVLHGRGAITILANYNSPRTGKAEDADPSPEVRVSWSQVGLTCVVAPKELIGCVRQRGTSFNTDTGSHNGKRRKLFCFFAKLCGKMATHSSVLAWRISGTGEPGGPPSMGSHRVGHDWSDSAAVAVSILCLFWNWFLCSLLSWGVLYIF